jgi:hypothetical protein
MPHTWVLCRCSKPVFPLTMASAPSLHKDSTLSASASALLHSPYSQRLGRRRPVGEAAATKIAGRPEATAHPLVLTDKQGEYNRALGAAKFSTALPSLPPYVSPVRARSASRTSSSAHGGRGRGAPGPSVPGGVEEPQTRTRPSTGVGLPGGGHSAPSTPVRATTASGEQAKQGMEDEGGVRPASGSRSRRCGGWEGTGVTVSVAVVCFWSVA